MAPDDVGVGQPAPFRLGDTRRQVHESQEDLEKRTLPHDTCVTGDSSWLVSLATPGIDTESRAARRSEERDGDGGSQLVYGERLEPIGERQVCEQGGEDTARPAGAVAERRARPLVMVAAATTVASHTGMGGM